MNDAFLDHLRTHTPHALLARDLLAKDTESHTFSLHTSNSLWLVLSGHVDIFATPQQSPQTRRHHLWQIQAHEAIFSFPLPPHENTITLQGILAPNTQVLCLSATEVWQTWAKTSQESSWFTEALGMTERWIDTLATTLPSTRLPSMNTTFTQGFTAIASGRALYPATPIRWIWQSGCRWQLVGEKDTVFTTEAGLLPTAPGLWYRALSSVRVQPIHTPQISDVTHLQTALASVHTAFLHFITLQMGHHEQQEQIRILQTQSWRDHQMAQALSSLAETYVVDPALSAKPVTGTHPDPLFAACQRIGRYLGISVQQPPTQDSRLITNHTKSALSSIEPRDQQQQMAQIESIFLPSSCYVRRVQLQGTWWMNAVDPLLVFLQDRHQPVALLPTVTGRLQWNEPGSLSPQFVDVDTATQLKPVAYVISRSLPATRITGRKLLALGLQHCGQELRSILVLGCLAGLFTLSLPIATSFCLNIMVPGKDKHSLLLLSVVLLTTTLVLSVVQGVRGLAIVRLEGKLDARLQIAIWDRLLRVPVSFYRQYTTSDLALRSTSIHTIRQTLSGTVVSTVLDASFATLHLFLLFAYHWILALAACLILFVVVTVGFLISWRLLRMQRAFLECHTQVASTTFQLLQGIEKLRVAGAESPAFAVWADRIVLEKQWSIRIRRITQMLTVFQQVIPVVASMIFFASIDVMATPNSIDAGTWIAFLTSFGIVMLSAVSTQRAMLEFVHILPTWERLKPLLQTLPETADQHTLPDPLQGGISLDHVSFRYQPDTPTIVEDISFHIHPGQFVAIVGASGSGKSTLLRLMLGLLEPETGSICYDHRELRHLHLPSVRRQIGAVLQQGHLMSGSIFSNIASTEDISLDEAWNAARLAGIAEDIKQMPMGMQTLVPEDGAGFSGGQRQRILIARALARNPRILFFDEATSSLDELSQAHIIQNLEHLQVTRIMIAHRISTIQNADQIFVLQQGRLVEQGTYLALIEQRGIFYKLAQLQE